MSMTLADTLGVQRMPVWPGDRCHAAIPGASPPRGNAGNGLHERLEVALVGRAFPGEPCGARSRPAAERIYLDAGVV